MTQLRSEAVDESLVQKSSRAGVGYILDRKFANVLRKIEGEPGVDSSAPPSHALREALVALKLASRSEITRVLLGEAAYAVIHQRGGSKRTNCDVVGIIEKNRGVALG